MYNKQFKDSKIFVPANKIDLDNMEKIKDDFVKGTREIISNCSIGDAAYRLDIFNFLNLID